MNRSNWIWPLLIILSAVGVSVLTQTDSQNLLRALLTFWFLLVCPGMALVRLLRLANSVAEWSIAIGLSIALSALVSIWMLYLAAWEPLNGLRWLIAISVVGACLQLVMAYGRDAGRLFPDVAARSFSASKKTASKLYALVRSIESALWTILFLLFSLGFIVFIRAMFR